MKQMRVPCGTTHVMMKAGEIPSGAFATIHAANNGRLFFVSWHNQLQGFFPVLEDGRVAKNGKPAPLMPFEEVPVFLGKDIPGIQINNGQIVWDTADIEADKLE